MLVSKTGFAYNHCSKVAKTPARSDAMNIISSASYVAVILLSLEAFVLLLIPLAIVGGLWYGTRWLRRRLPPVFVQVRKYVALFNLYVERGCASIVAPLMAAHTLTSQVRAVCRGLAGFFPGEN
jgi:hypothetical protein